MDTSMFDHCFVDADFPEGVRVERIEGVGHFANQERRDRVNQLILTWLSGQASVAP